VIPSKLYIYGAALLALLLAWGGSMWWSYERGKAVDHEAWQASITADAVAQSNLVHASDIATNTVVTQYVDRVQVVMAQGATITKEVTKYVSAQADARYPVPVGFVSLLDAAGSGQTLDAGASLGTYDSPSPIALSVVGASIASNYTACRANAEQLSSLQSWVRSQQALTEKK